MTTYLKFHLVLAAVIAATLGITVPVAAQGIYAYPKGGQSAQQRQFERREAVQRGEYTRAYSACLQGRNYQVQ